MTASIKFFVAILLSCLVFKGECSACSLNNVTIGTVKNVRTVHGKPQWDVTVINDCPCPLYSLKLSCKGFQTLVPPNPAIFSKQGDTCLLLNGNPLGPKASVKFSYTWDAPFVLRPVSALIAGIC